MEFTLIKCIIISSVILNTFFSFGQIKQIKKQKSSNVINSQELALPVKDISKFRKGKQQFGLKSNGDILILLEN